MEDAKIIYVYKDWDVPAPEIIGTIHVEGGKGREVISFAYDDTWIENADASLVFDPDLMLYKVYSAGQVYVWNFCRFLSGQMGTFIDETSRSYQCKERRKKAKTSYRCGFSSWGLR